MSQENVELARRLVEAFNKQDIEAFINCLDPSVEYHPVMTVAGGAAYHGQDGVQRYFADFGVAWGDDCAPSPRSTASSAMTRSCSSRSTGRGQTSGAEVAMPGAQVSRWRDGLLVYAKAHVHREDALRDLGVSEDALEPIDP